MASFDPRVIETRFRREEHSYRKLAHEIQTILEARLATTHVKTSPITARIKDYRSFIEKVVRKRYFGAPFEQIEDIAGVRVRCIFPGDTTAVEKAIRESFEIISFEDKSTAFEEDEFRYQSIHFVVRLLPAYSQDPRLAKLARLRCEIQVRTLGQDAWSEVSHGLSYKPTAMVPPAIRRRLNALSALFEVADREFEAIRALYVDLISEDSNRVGPSESVEIGSLSRLIAQRYAWHPMSEATDNDELTWIAELAVLCDELIRHGLTRIDEVVKLLGDETEVDAQDAIARRGMPDSGIPFSSEHFYDPIGRIRIALALGDVDYRTERPILIDPSIPRP